MTLPSTQIGAGYVTPISGVTPPSLSSYGSSSMAAIAGPLLGAGVSGLFNAAGGKSQADAAKYAALLQSQGAQKALDFAKQSAEGDWRNFETTRQANYGQWKAQEGRMNTLGHLIGMPDRDVPAYVPSVDPRLDASVQGQPSQFSRPGRMRDLL